MAINYSVAIDRDDDGSFTGTGEAISADVLALRWRLGMRQAHDLMAEPGTAQITVENRDQTYSPEVNPLQPGQMIRIQSDDGITVRTHFIGHITRIEPLPGDQGQRTAVIHAADALWQLGQHSIRLPPQINTHAHTVIAQVLDRIPFRRTKLKGYWVLGRVNHSELGSNTRLPIITVPRDLETGKTSFIYVGDTWGDGIPAVEAIRQVIESERGRLFVDRSGQVVFYNRHHLLIDSTPLAPFADDMHGTDYAYGAGVISHVQVRLLPRSVGTPQTVLWQLENALQIPAGAAVPLQVVARFRDAENRPIGALALIPPVPNLDYTANLKNDGSDLDMTSSIDVILRRVDFSAALLEIRNRARQHVYLQAGAQLRGTPLYIGDPLLLEQVSYGSQVFYPAQALFFDLPTLDSAEQAESLARYELARRKTPRGHLRSLTLNRHPHAAQIVARTLFDRITVQESQTGHSADYFIVAEAHSVDLGGQRHQVTWTLESAEANHFWLLGRNRINTDAVLAY